MVSIGQHELITASNSYEMSSELGGWVGELRGRRNVGPANGQEVNPRGQGPRGYGKAARRLPAFEARDAGGVTPLKYR